MANKFMIVLFNLNEDQNEDDFVEWMKDNDIPVVSKLSSVTEYNLAKTIGMLGAEGEPPYKYMEIITSVCKYYAVFSTNISNGFILFYAFICQLVARKWSASEMDASACCQINT